MGCVRSHLRGDRVMETVAECGPGGKGILPPCPLAVPLGRLRFHLGSQAAGHRAWAPGDRSRETPPYNRTSGSFLKFIFQRICKSQDICTQGLQAGGNPGVVVKSEMHSVSFFFFINLFILFIYFWLRWVFVAAHGLSLVAGSGGYSSWRCVGFLLWWLLLLWSTGFSNCGTRAQ